MHNIWIIAKKEYKQYFTSPVAYAVLFLIFLILGIIFYANIIVGSYQGVAPTIHIIIGPLVTLILFTTPAITMRTMSEEQRSGTIELLLTSPVHDREIIIGKWLGAFLFLLTIILITWIYPFILNQLIKPGIDQGLLISTYLGLILFTSAISAIGVAVSSFFSNQIAAFFSTLAILLVFWMISYPSQAMGSTGGNEFLQYLDLSQHFYNTFYSGIINIKDIIYYLSVSSLALFMGAVSVETRRWR